MMEHLLDFFGDIIISIVIWMGYVHIYGISLSLYKDKNRFTHKPDIYYQAMCREQIWNKIKNLKTGVIFWGICLVGVIMANASLEETERGITIVLYLICLHAFIYCAAIEKKLRTSLWLWMVFFTIALPMFIMDAVCQVLGAGNLENNIAVNFFIDFLLLFLMIVLYFLDKKTHFAKRVQQKEKFLLVTICIFISFVGIFAFSEESQLEIGGSKVLALLAYLLLSAFALIMVIRVIAVGTTANYYEELSTMHEKNAKETLAIYESYKEAQIETRKLRHDMRNHFFCIQMLAKEEKYEEMEEYLQNINEAVTDISMKFQTGNDIVDAILNVKQDIAKKKGIQIFLEGNIPIMPFVDAMDWCKIFSNAIDNGIEALEKCEEAKRRLQIQLKSNKHFLVIQIKNPCMEKVQISENGVVTSKKDAYQHGFGLKNMETALKKYGGELKLTCKEEKEGYVFIVDMMLQFR